MKVPQEAYQHIWVQKDQYDCLGTCMELTAVTRSSLYYARFDGINSRTFCLSRIKHEHGNNPKFFTTQRKMMEYAVSNLERRLEFIKKKDAQGWYNGYNGIP